MKIAILHYSSWPEFGGVENVIRDQANLLFRAGHEVTVISGEGKPSDTGIPFLLVPEMARDFPLNASVRAVLERGQSDQSFNVYLSLLMETLEPVFSVMDFVIVHNVFTTHFNLPLTRALHDLASKHRLIAWTHDLTATNTDYAMPNPTKAPWNLVRQSVPGVTYVATSRLRADEITTHLQPPVNAVIVPNPLDLGRLFGFTPEMVESLPSLGLSDRDYIFFLPSRLMLRKNVEFALDVVRKLRDLGKNPLLLVSGAKDTHSLAAEQYSEFLRLSAKQELEAHVVFVNDFFKVNDKTLRDLYSLADCVLFFSRQEGFGMPIIEAAFHRLPVWCSDIPAFRFMPNHYAYLLDDIKKVDQAIEWLENQPAFQAQRMARQLFDPQQVYEEYYLQLFSNLVAKV